MSKIVDYVNQEPAVDATNDLGSTTKRYKNIFLSGDAKSNTGVVKYLGLTATASDSDKVDGHHVGTSLSTIPLLDGVNKWSGTNYISTSNIAAFKVGTGSTLQVDTVQNTVGINMVPSAYTLDIRDTSVVDYSIGINYEGNFDSTSKSHYGASFQVNNQGANTLGFTLRGMIGFCNATFGSFANTTPDTIYLEGTVFYTSNGFNYASTDDLLLFMKGGYFVAQDQGYYQGTAIDTIEATGGQFEIYPYLVVDKPSGSLSFKYAAGIFINNFYSIYNYVRGAVTGEIYGIDSLVITDIEGWDFSPPVYGVKSKINFYADASAASNLYLFYADYEQPGASVVSPIIYGFYNNTTGNIFVGGDNSKLLLGTGQDASIAYNGTDLVVTTAAVGTGVVKFGSSSNFTAGGSSVGTITNAPSAGNPNEWLKIKDSSGNIKYIPCWS